MEMKNKMKLCLKFVLWICLFSWIQQCLAESGFCRYSKLEKTQTKTKKTTTNFWGQERTYTKYKKKYIKVYYQECCEGWKGSDCLTPICEPDCGTNEVCVLPNECYCNGKRGSCELVECSFRRDCFPGTCVQEGNEDTCNCASGFSGDNCRTMVDGGLFSHCTVNIHTVGSEDAPSLEAECDTTPFISPQVYYTNGLDVNHLMVGWEAYYLPTSDSSISHRGSIIRHEVGLADSSLLLSVKDQDGNIVFNHTQECSGSAVSASDPANSMVCGQFRLVWPPSHAVQHGWSIQATFYTLTGGYKRLVKVSNQEVVTRDYVGASTTEHFTIVFDGVMPQHCTFSGNCTLEETPAIYIHQDITQDSVVMFLSYGWWDDDSGMKHYTYRLYKMAANQDGLLVEDSEVLQTVIVESEHEDSPSQMELEESGMYSIILTTEDSTGNYVRARALVLYDDSNNGVSVDDDVTVTVAGATVTERGHWVTSTTEPITINWAGKFRNHYHEENKLLSAVAPRDDVTPEVDDTIGNRTLTAIRNTHGIVRFEVAWVVNNITGQPSVWYDVPEVESEQYEYDVIRQDGDSLLFYIRAYDVMGASKTHSITIYTDSTGPSINTGTAPIINTAPDSFESSLQFNTSDSESGIVRLEFNIRVSGSSGRRRRDSDDRRIVHSGNQTGNIAADRNERDCLILGTCYCTRARTCYYYLQRLRIDNCWLREEEGTSLSMEYFVYNSAGMSTSSTHNLGTVSDTTYHGVAYYPPPRDVEVTQDFAQIRVTWRLEVTCYSVLYLLFSITTEDGVTERQLAANATYHLIGDILPDTSYPIEVIVVYEGEIESDPGQPETPFVSEIYGTVVAPEDDEFFTLTNIIGIAVGGFLVLVIIALVITMIVRKRQEKPVVPEVVRRTAGNVRDRLSRYTSRLSSIGGRGFPTRSSLRRPGHASGHGRKKVTFSGKDQSLYIEDENSPGNMKLNVEYMRKSGFLDDDIFAYGISDPPSIEKWTKSEDSVRIEKPLPKVKSRFADLMMASLKTDEGRVTVVAKMCKPNANDMDRILMRSKMNFMGEKCPKHVNILEMLGAVTTHPILLFEYCDVGRLYDWLVRLETVTAVEEDLFIQFSMQICKALEVLHENEITHKRLFTRNVLLKSTSNGKMVVKVMGFGPMKGDEEKDQIFLKKASKTKAKKEHEKNELVPFKWLAPEQLDTDELGRRPYNEQTDAWGFAVTLWEIFSKGQMPYGKKTNPEMYDAVKSGYRLERPDNCPPFLYDEVMTPCFGDAESRPSFARMYQDMEAFFSADMDDIAAGAGRESAFLYDPDAGIFTS